MLLLHGPTIVLYLCVFLLLTQLFHGHPDRPGYYSVVTSPESLPTKAPNTIEDLQTILDDVASLRLNVLYFTEDIGTRLMSIEALLSSLVAQGASLSAPSIIPNTYPIDVPLPYETPPPYPTPHNGSYHGTGITAGPTGTGYSYWQPTPSPTSSDAWDSQVTSNIAVHHRIFDNSAPLSNLCDDSNVNIVILDFLFTFANLTEGWPDMWYGPECYSDSRAPTVRLLSLGAADTGLPAVRKEDFAQTGPSRTGHQLRCR